MNWDDIKIFLEVARSERLSIAAKRLAMDASTVSRRLHKLEQQLESQLFERTIDGHVLTDDGKKLLNSARQMEQNASNALEQIKNNNQANCGKVRIGVTEAFGNFFVAAHLLALQQDFPDIQIDLLHFSRFVKISRNEADIAIAVERPKSTSMIVSKLCDYKLQLYAHPNYLHQVTEGEIKLEDLGQHKWVSYVDNLLFTDELSYLKELASHLNEPLIPRFNSTSIISQYSAIKSGLGIGVLPCFVGDLDNELIKLHPQEIDIVRSFWLVTHPESKRLSHVATVWDYLKKLVKQQESLLMPK
ncbi:MAG: DNA-binding transcriptional LysR family regulator [Alteromonadaceae bacterium]|jgi:DNA-binding transcriptional LysR family regulator|tara:strand:- start:307 stop:1212 length:906 start_codon:yes stop_codon:yes gene_type:complete